MPDLLDLSGKKVKAIRAPAAFSAPVDEKLIGRAFWIMFTHHLQRKGRDPLAGERTSAQSWQTGHGVARVARIKGEKNPRSGQAAGVDSVVKGRLAHPSRAEKVIYKNINRKERALATVSAVSATALSEYVQKRGHRLGKKVKLPLVVVDDLEKISKTSRMISFLKKMGLEEEMERASRGKFINGRIRYGRGPLLVVTDDKKVRKASGNIRGLDVVVARDVSVLDLAPGGRAGRLTVWTESAFKEAGKRLAGVVKDGA